MVREELDFYLEKRVNTSVIIPKHRAWVTPADSYAVELWDALEASEARCKEMEEALRLLVHRTKTTRERLNTQGVTVPLWTEISFSDAYEKALGVLGEGGLLERREEA